MSNKTIVAISTPQGNALRGIIRLSGPDSFKLVRQVIRKNISRAPGWSSQTTKLHLNKLKIPARLYLMRAPRSYTCENSAEIHTFGPTALLDHIFKYFISQGVQLAQPGEFTRRAFLNGRISLSQAEAVLNIIHSSSEQEYRLAVNQLKQHAFRSLRTVNQRLLDLVTQVELAIDFSDQNIEIVSRQRIYSELKIIIADIKKTIAETANPARIETDGVSIMLCGLPNAGKSSLFNRLVKNRCNIVSPMPGTTRDAIEGRVSYRNMSFRIFDTAGTSAPDKLSTAPLNQADIYLLVVDASLGLTKENLSLFDRLNAKKTLLVFNKSDLPTKNNTRAKNNHVQCSANTGAGLVELKTRLTEMIRCSPPGRLSSQAAINLRLIKTLGLSLHSLQRLTDAAVNNRHYELIAMDLRTALEHLNSVLGGFSIGSPLTADDILNNIFSQFCIGK